MRKKSIIGILLITILTTVCFVGCMNDSDDQSKTQQEKVLQQANDQVGLPNITNFYEKKLAKKVLELRDDSKLVCYAYTTNMNGKYIYLGKTLGYGLPYSTQYTNPQKVAGTNGAVIAQADPNALFNSSGTSATWLVMIDEKTGEQSVVYAEPNIVVTQTKLPKRLIEEWSLPDNY